MIIRWTISVRAHVQPDNGGEGYLVSDQKMLFPHEVDAVFDPDNTLPGAAVIYRTVAPMFAHIDHSIRESQS